MGDESEWLRRERGDGDVEFAQVADYLHDFTGLNPDGDTVQRMAALLADVESLAHDHAADPDRGLD